MTSTKFRHPNNGDALLWLSDVQPNEFDTLYYNDYSFTTEICVNLTKRSLPNFSRTWKKERKKKTESEKDCFPLHHHRISFRAAWQRPLGNRVRTLDVGEKNRKIVEKKKKDQVWSSDGEVGGEKMAEVKI